MEENNNENIQKSDNNKSSLLIPIAGILLVIALGAAIFAKSGKREPIVAGSSSEINSPISEELSESTSDEISENKSLPTESTTANNNTEVNPNLNIINVEGGMFYFKPNEIRVKKGQPVKIVFNNVEGIHDFVIDELGVRSKMVKDGESDTFEFTPEKSGTFEFYCSVGNHRQMGMKGKLIVE